MKISVDDIRDLIDSKYEFFRGKNLTAKASTYTSKGLAMIVGLICLAIAFVAKYLGGVLQAALTIFGVVGGPMLGLFTLGMFTETANQNGAIMGLLCSLGFTLWIGFGQPKPPISELIAPENCIISSVDSPNLLEKVEEDVSSFYLYRISYMWYCPLGFVTCLLMGLLVSVLTNLVSKGSRKELDSNLFVPFVASRISKNREIVKNRSAFETLEIISKHKARQQMVYAG